MQLKIPSRCFVHGLFLVNSLSVESYIVNPGHMRHCSVETSSHCLPGKPLSKSLNFHSSGLHHGTRLLSTANDVHFEIPPKFETEVESFVINEKIRDITTSLLDDSYDKYWSNQLNKDQMENTKFALQAWSQVTSSPKETEQGAEYIERIIKRLEDEKKNGNEAVDLNLGIYNLLIDVWTKSGYPDRAETILRQLQSMKELFPESIMLTNLPYNTVIHSWKRSSEGEKAEEVLRMMIKGKIEPDEISYNGVVLSYARNYGKRGYADNAQRVLEEMEKTDLPIDAFLFNTVMDAHAKSQTPESAEKALQLLIKLEQYGGKHGIYPNTISYTTVIDSFAKAKSEDSASNAEMVFRKMEAAHKSGNEDARPNNRSFNAVINAYVQTSAPGSALRAEQILMKMLTLSKNGNEEAKPNVVTFTTVMNGWAKSGESGSGERAQKIFELAVEEFQQGNAEAQPNSFMYSALIDAWIKSRDKGAVDRSFKIYSDLYNEFLEGKGNVKPSTFLANQVIDAISRSGKSGAGDRVEEVLKMLDYLYTQYDDDDMRPTQQSYTMSINAWAKSRSFGKAKKAQQLLFKMEEAYRGGNSNAKPNVFAFTAVVSTFIEFNELRLIYFNLIRRSITIAVLYTAKCMCIYSR